VAVNGLQGTTQFLGNFSAFATLHEAIKHHALSFAEQIEVHGVSTMRRPRGSKVSRTRVHSARVSLKEAMPINSAQSTEE